MDILVENADIQAILGRDEDFTGMENDTLPDFTQLEHFINSENDEHNNYFADTLANQEASRHSHVMTTSHHADSVLMDSSVLMATQRPVGVGRMYASNPQHPQQQHPASVGLTASIRSSLGPPYTPALHCGAYHVTHPLPESPPDSASEPPFSPPETICSGSSIGGSPLNEHGRGQSRYLLANETFGSLFGASLDLKNDLAVNPHGVYATPTTLQPQNLPMMSAQQFLPAGSAMNQCLSSVTPTPTIYTIEDHGGGANSLVNLTAGSGASASGASHQKKRKLSSAETASPSSSTSANVKQEPHTSPGASSGSGSSSSSPRQVAPPVAAGGEEDYSYEFSADSSMFNDSYQCIRFQAFQQNTWHQLYDRNLKELQLPNYRVDADKGFNLSNTDEAFVCQKKNHFQITCHVQQSGEPYYVKSAEGPKKVDNFYLHFFGVKAEAATQMIRVEQSQSDRSKKPFHPVLLELQQDQVSKITVGRLHFNETTANNMRKKGKPNPDQRFFNLVVSLQAHCAETTYTIVAHSSERIIVRASNPGMFENEVEQNWQRGTTADSIFHAGRVGINTDRPDEAFVVHGNIKVTGHLVQPSDNRAKENIKEVDTKEQLRNVAALRVVHYNYTDQFAETAGLRKDERADTGVIAQEVKIIIPEAVRPAGNIILPDGSQIENFLVVNKERIFMENVGAVKELCKVTDNLETRIDELERMNHKLAKLKRLDSIRSDSAISSSGKPSLSLDLRHVGSVASSVVRRPQRKSSCKTSAETICANRLVQAIVIMLVIIMAMCLIAMATLYIHEWQKRNSDILLDAAESQRSGERHTVLNYTDSSVYSEGRMVFTRNKTSKPPDVVNWLNDGNATNATDTTPSHRTGVLLFNNTSVYPPSTRSFTSLSSVKPDPVGKPDTCSSNCQIYCCVANEAVGVSSTVSPLGTSTTTRTQWPSTDSTGSASASPSTTEVFTNNVENFRKSVKSRNFEREGGPSSAADFDPRASFAQFYYQKPWDKKPVWLSRFKRHLSQERNLGSRGPTEGDFWTRSPSWKTPSSQPSGAAWDGRVSYIRLVGARFNVTLGPSYCMSDSNEYIRCLNDHATNYTYGIPLSKHMPDPSLTLQFHFTTAITLQPEQCSSPVRLGACPDGQRDPLGANSIIRGPTVNHADSVARSFFVDVGRSSIVAYRFRFPVSRGDAADLCDKPSASVGDKFVEYNLVFYRLCDD